MTLTKRGNLAVPATAQLLAGMAFNTASLGYVDAMAHQL